MQPKISPKIKKKPGKAPKLSDDLLTKTELEKRNRRRRNNREAATGVRKRRNGQISHLENEAKLLKKKNADDEG